MYRHYTFAWQRFDCAIYFLNIHMTCPWELPGSHYHRKCEESCVFNITSPQIQGGELNWLIVCVIGGRGGHFTGLTQAWLVTLTIAVNVICYICVVPALMKGLLKQRGSVCGLLDSAQTVLTAAAVKLSEWMLADGVRIVCEKYYCILSIQISFTNLVSVDEKLTYKPHPQDPEK